MKFASFLMLSGFLALSACSHHHKKNCSGEKKDKMSCTKSDCKKECCDKADKMCTDGSCTKTEEKKACCSGDSCHKKS